MFVYIASCNIILAPKKDSDSATANLEPTVTLVQ